MRIKVNTKDLGETGKQKIFKSLCISMGVPEPETEKMFHSSRKWRFDYCWPEFMTALEVEGITYGKGGMLGGRHVSVVGFKGDLEKYNSATSLGWKVLRVTPDNLLKVNTIELIKQTINH